LELRPLIGITPGYTADNDRLFIANGYVEGINRSGGLGLLLPLSKDPEVIKDAFGRCDGFLLTGGPDLDARYFGEANLRYNGEISPLRDNLEILVAQKAVEMKKPILAICRGMQVLNAALGGTIYQDIYEQIKDRELLKHTQEAPGWYPVHEVAIEKNSLLFEICRIERLGVNSFHHQAVKSLGKCLKVAALSSDGIIEAIELQDDSFTVGVQWHPERMLKEHSEAFSLFEALVKAAARSRV